MRTKICLFLQTNYNLWAAVVVSMLAFYSDELRLDPAEVYSREHSHKGKYHCTAWSPALLV